MRHGAVAALFGLAAAARFGGAGAASVDATAKSGDVPYQMPKLVPEIIPDKVDDSALKPPQFLVDAVKKRQIRDFSNVAAAHVDVHDDLGAALRSTPTPAPTAWDGGGGTPVVGREIEELHKDETEAPPKIGCGNRIDQIHCTDNLIPGGETHPDDSVSPGGDPRKINPSWSTNPELDPEYTMPHQEFFQPEEKCEPDEGEDSFNRLEQELELNLQDYSHQRAYKNQHVCKGLVKNIELQYHELKTKVETRRRTMNRRNAQPFVQEEKIKEQGPHRRLLQAGTPAEETAGGNAASSPQSEASGSGQGGSGSGSGSGGASADSYVRIDNGDMDLTRSPIDGKDIPKRPLNDVLPYEAPDIDMRHFNKAMEDVQDCLDRAQEMQPMLRALMAMSQSRTTYELSSETETALQLGKPPPGEPGQATLIQE